MHQGQRLPLLLLRHLQPPLTGSLLVSSLTPPRTDFFLGGRRFGGREKSGVGSSPLLKAR